MTLYLFENVFKSMAIIPSLGLLPEFNGMLFEMGGCLEETEDSSCLVEQGILFSLTLTSTPSVLSLPVSLYSAP